MGTQGEKIRKICLCFDRVHERDEQTDGRTDTARRHRPRLCIASCWIKTVNCAHAQSSLNRDGVVVVGLSDG